MGLLSTVRSRLRGEDNEFEQEIERAFREGSWPEGVEDFEPLSNTGQFLPDKPDIDPLADESLPGNRFKAQHMGQRYEQDSNGATTMMGSLPYEEQIPDSRVQGGSRFVSQDNANNQFKEPSPRGHQAEFEEGVRVVDRPDGPRPRKRQTQAKPFAERFRERVEAAQMQESEPAEFGPGPRAAYNGRPDRNPSRRQRFQEPDEDRDIWQTRRVDSSQRNRENAQRPSGRDQAQPDQVPSRARRQEREVAEPRLYAEDRASQNGRQPQPSSPSDLGRGNQATSQEASRTHKSAAFAQPSMSQRTSGTNGAAYGSGIPTACEVVYPRRIDDVGRIAEIAVVQHRPVVIVLSGSPSDVARRVLDFSYGLCCGINASLKELGTRVFVLLPYNTALSEADMVQLKRKAIVKG